MAKGKQRDKRVEARWRRIIRDQAHSGLSIREFCRRSEAPESAFYFWRRELQRRGTAPEQPQRPSSRPAFVPVRVTAPDPPIAAGVITIHLSDACRIHVAPTVDRAALTDVLAVLRFEALTAASHTEGADRSC